MLSYQFGELPYYIYRDGIALLGYFRIDLPYTKAEISAAGGLQVSPKSSIVNKVARSAAFIGDASIFYLSTFCHSDLGWDDNQESATVDAAYTGNLKTLVRRNRHYYIRGTNTVWYEEYNYSTVCLTPAAIYFTSDGYARGMENRFFQFIGADNDGTPFFQGFSEWRRPWNAEHYYSYAKPSNNILKLASSTSLGLVNTNLPTGWPTNYYELPGGETHYVPYYQGTTLTIDSSYWERVSANPIFTDAYPFIKNDDPYGGPEDPKDGGGGGAHGKWGDTVGDDPEPTLSLSDTGMVTPYAPTLAQLKSFSQYLWSDAFSVDTFKKMFADPFQAIITCHALPFTVTSGGAADVAFGNIATDVSMNTLSKQYYTIDAGTLSIAEYWGSFFDYSPYTSYMIYLPYVGYKEIKPEDFTTGSITIKYIVDAITGAFTVRLLSSKVNGSALYQYTGDMAYSIPLSKSDYSSIISNIVSSAAAIGGGIAALAATGSAATLGSAAMSTIGKVTSSKVQVQRSGSVGGAAGWYASQTPYIIRTRPNPVLASNQNYFVGRPSYQTATLSQLSGYTKVKDIRLTGVTGTDSEKDEIVSLLKEGVIL